MQSIQNTVKNERLVSKIMGDEDLKSKIQNVFVQSKASFEDLSKRTTPHNLRTIAQQASALNRQMVQQISGDVGWGNITFNAKNDGMSPGLAMFDKATGDIAYIKHDRRSIGGQELTFAFVSKLLYNMGFGSRCEFLYNATNKQMITLSAQIGHSKGKKFTEVDEVLQAHVLALKYRNEFVAIETIIQHLGLGDTEYHNYGVVNDESAGKFKIFDFIVDLKRVNLLTEEQATKIKQYAKDWKSDDTLETYMGRKFTETLNDGKIQELLHEMPGNETNNLNEYCKKIVGMGVDELAKASSREKPHENLSTKTLSLQKQGRNNLSTHLYVQQKADGKKSVVRASSASHNSRYSKL